LILIFGMIPAAPAGGTASQAVAARDLAGSLPSEFLAILERPG
jgi:hypothetical protein